MLHYTYTACLVLCVKKHVYCRYSSTLHVIWNSFVTRFVCSSDTCRYSVVFEPKPTNFVLHFSLTELPLSHKVRPLYRHFSLFAQNTWNGRKIVRLFFSHFSSPKLLNIFLRTWMMRFCTATEQGFFLTYFVLVWYKARFTLMWNRSTSSSF